MPRPSTRELRRTDYACCASALCRARGFQRSKLSTAGQRIFVGGGFSHDKINIGAQRLPLAVIFPRAFDLLLPHFGVLLCAKRLHKYYGFSGVVIPNEVRDLSSPSTPPRNLLLTDLLGQRQISCEEPNFSCDDRCNAPIIRRKGSALLFLVAPSKDFRRSSKEVVSCRPPGGLSAAGTDLFFRSPNIRS
jgi:hypothetical protein